MKRAQWISIAVIAAFGALIVVLMLRNPQAPVLPTDPLHVWRGAENCETCHGPGADLPRSKNHPIGQDCVRCHGQGS